MDPDVSSVNQRYQQKEELDKNIDIYEQAKKGIQKFLLYKAVSLSSV